MAIELTEDQKEVLNGFSDLFRGLVINSTGHITKQTYQSDPVGYYGILADRITYFEENNIPYTKRIVGNTAIVEANLTDATLEQRIFLFTGYNI